MDTWAFGSDAFAEPGPDPLAGIDTSVPPGLDAAELAADCLRLGDDALILAQRVAEWCSRAPELEEDIALANLALDLLGQARLLLARAAVADPAVVPALPPGSPVPAEDALAFFRDADQFRNSALAEVPNGDFAHVVVRLLLFSVARLDLLRKRRDGTDAVVAAIAAKGIKELTYHRDWAARWFVTLAQGTDESRRRVLAALGALWPLRDSRTDALRTRGADSADADAVLDQVFAAADVERPADVPVAEGDPGVRAELLADMQSVARAHPMGRW